MLPSSFRFRCNAEFWGPDTAALRHHALPARLGGWRVLDQVSGANDVTPAVDVLSVLIFVEGIAACIGLSSCSRGCRLKWLPWHPRGRQSR